MLFVTLLWLVVIPKLEGESILSFQESLTLKAFYLEKTC